MYYKISIILEQIQHGDWALGQYHVWKRVTVIAIFVDELHASIRQPTLSLQYKPTIVSGKTSSELIGVHSFHEYKIYLSLEKSIKGTLEQSVFDAFNMGNNRLAQTLLKSQYILRQNVYCRPMIYLKFKFKFNL